MRDLLSKAAKYRAEARRRKLWQRAVSLLVCVVVFVTTYAQILPAIALEADLFEPDGHVHTDECYKIVKTEEKTELDCPLELHTHTAACYNADGALACGYADFVVHTHDSNCYDENGKLVCTLPEIEEHTHTALCYPVRVDGPADGTDSTGVAHVHTDECYTEMPGALLCGEEETDGHTHTEDCYVETEQLVCELEESEGHTHTDLCMDTEGLPELCGLEESEGHTHDESCYETVRELVCEQEEAEPHTHTEDCYASVEKELTCGFEESESEEKSEGTEETPDPFDGEDKDPQPICGQEEIELHTHTAACFGAGGAVVCGQLEVLEHQHTEDCLRVVQEASEEKVLDCAYTGSADKADEERPADSSTAGKDEEKPADSGATGGEDGGKEDGTTAPSDPDDEPVLTPATLAERVLAAAESYIGYKEDAEDCDIDADGETRGLTQFGLHYGMPYEKWDAMFVAYCLEEAGVEELPSAADCLFDIDVWASMLDGAGYCQTAELYTPVPGDLAFFDLDEDGTLDHVAIVEKATDKKLSVIAGDMNDCVRRASYDLTDERLVAYGILPRADEPEAPDEGEITDKPDTPDDGTAGEGSDDDEITGEPDDTEGKPDEDKPDDTEEKPGEDDEEKPGEGSGQQTAADRLLAEVLRHIGYVESADDTLEEDGESRGATLYGTYYGCPYEKWNVLFVAYCLEKAGVKDLPAAADCDFDADQWIALLTEAERFEPAGLYTPVPGDLVFLDLDEDSAADHVAVVEKTVEGHLCVIAGDVASAAADVADSVCRVSYALPNEAVLGYTRLAEQADAPDKDTSGQEPVVLSVKGEAVTVNAVYEAGVLPAGVTLHITEYGADSEEFDSIGQKLGESLAKNGGLLANIYPVEVHFEDGQGTEIEPKGPVTVTVTFAEPIHSDNENASHWAVFHLVANADVEELKDASVECSEKENERLITGFTFQSDTFSEFVLAEWNGKALSDKVYSYEDEEILAEVVLKGETVLPEGTKLVVQAITEEAEDYGTMVWQAEEAVARDAAQIVLYDISFYTPEGEYIPVDENAAVSLRLKQVEPVKETDEVVVLHYQEEKALPVVLESSEQKDAMPLALDDESTAAAVSFETEGFSVFAVMTLEENADPGPSTSSTFYLTHEYSFAGAEKYSYILTFKVVDTDGNPLNGVYTNIDNSPDNNEYRFSVIAPTIAGYVYQTAWYNDEIVHHVVTGNKDVNYAFRIYTPDDQKYYSRATNLVVTLVYASQTQDLDGRTFAIVNTVAGNRALTAKSKDVNTVLGLESAAVPVLTASGGKYWVGYGATAWTFNKQENGTYKLSTTVGDTVQYLRLRETLYGSSGAGSLTLTADIENASQIVVIPQQDSGRVVLGCTNADGTGSYINLDNSSKIFWCYQGTGFNSQHYLCEIKPRASKDYTGSWVIVTKISGTAADMHGVALTSATQDKEDATNLGDLAAKQYDMLVSHDIYEVKFKKDEENLDESIWSFEIPKVEDENGDMQPLPVEEGAYYISVQVDGKRKYLSFASSGNKLEMVEEPSVIYVNESGGDRTGKVRLTNSDGSKAVDLYGGEAKNGFGVYNGNDNNGWFALCQTTVNAGVVADVQNHPSSIINLFDYWLTDRDDQDFPEVPKNNPFTGFTDGINKNHALKFSYNRDNSNMGTDGKWNVWTHSANVYKGIVASTLGDDGYPRLSNNDSVFAPKGDNVESGVSYDESLKYLFEPEDDNYKKSFTNVTGLLQVDSQGYYYYNSAENFAEFNEDEKKFTLYDTWGVLTGGSSPNGQFFPFNQMSTVSRTKSTDPAINHYLGMTLTTRFVQQYGGHTSSTRTAETVFEFAGDDDVWIFIDGVLVADLGGIHDAASVSIDFSTGDVTVNGASEGTLRSLFEAAGKSCDWNGFTFADKTYHTLKFFYLERGNTDSNLYLKYNLTEIPTTSIYKVSQYGEPVEGAKFSIYPKTDKNYNITSSIEPIDIGETNKNGEIVFLNDDNMPYSLNELKDAYGEYFVLRETEAPDGYALVSSDIHLHIVNGMLLCENTKQSGVWATTTLQVAAPSILKMANGGMQEFYDLSGTNQIHGTLFAVVLKRDKDGNIDDEQSWAPVYGNSQEGYMVEDTSGGFINAAIRAAQKQTEHDNVTFALASSGAMQLTMEHLPGDIQTYYHICKDSNATKYTIAYYWTSADSLDGADDGNTWRVDAEDNSAPFDRAFGATIEVPNIANRLFAQKLNEEGELLNGAVFALYNVTQETDGTIYYLTNDQKIMLKPDDGSFNFGTAYVYGAAPCNKYKVETQEEGHIGEIKIGPWDDTTKSFATVLYTIKPYDIATTLSKENTNNASGEDGTAIFSKIKTGTYYMREVIAPAGYQLNPTEVMVLITADAVYANAGTEMDGITVARGPGYLVSTLDRFASIGNIDNTLSWIYAQMYVTKVNNSFSAYDSKEWINGKPQIGTTYLKYDPDHEDSFFNYLLNEGRADAEDAIATRRLYTDVGWSYYVLYQDYEYGKDQVITSGANYEDWRGQEIANLFSRSTYIRVTDQENYKLPETGGTGTWAYTLAGMVLLGGAAWYCMARKRKGMR